MSSQSFSIPETSVRPGRISYPPAGGDGVLESDPASLEADAEEE